MRRKEIYIHKKNKNIGIVLEEYLPQTRHWIVQHLDFIDGRPVRSFIFEHASPKQIKKIYSKDKETAF